MIELEHSPLGGSSAFRFLNCAFSFLEHRAQLQAGKFIEIPSEFAALGTAAHEVGATCLQTGTEPYEHIGKEFSGFRVGFPEEIGLDAVSVYVNTCNRLINGVGMVDGTKFYVEKTFHLPEIHPLLKGTVDFGLINALGLWLIDYKNGEGIGVEAMGSEQLLYYAFLLILATPGVNNRPIDFPVHLGIVQPNFYGVFEEPEIWTTDIGYVLAWGYNTLLPRMNELMNRPADHGDADANPGDWCQFCPVLLHCPKMKKAFLDFADASEDFVTMLPDDELDALYAQQVYARRFMKALEQAVYARKVTGGNIASAKLVEKKVARVWKPGALPVLLATFGDKAYAPKKELSPAGIEKLSSRGKELAKEWGYKPETGGLTIAPQSDPRPEAVPRTNEKVFEAFAQSYEDQGF
jgi:hypothetical protein